MTEQATVVEMSTVSATEFIKGQSSISWRWKFIQANLKRIVSMKSSELNETIARAKPTSSRAHTLLRIMLFSLLILSAYAITIYQWQQWLASNHETIYSLSDKIFLSYANSIYLNVKNVASIGPRHNENIYYKHFIGLVNLTDINLPNLNLIGDIVYYITNFHLAYKGNTPCSSYFATEDNICPGGQVYGGDRDSNGNVIFKLRNPTISSCNYSSYSAGNTLRHRFNGTFVALRSKTYRPQERPWYIQAKAKGSAGWTDPYLYNQGQVGITCYKPFYSPNKTLLGVIANDAQVNAISTYLKSLSLGVSGVLFITTSSGLLVAANRGDVTMVDTITKVLRSSLSIESNNIIIMRTSKQLIQSYGSFSNVPSFDNLRDPDIIVSARVLRDDFGLDWRIVLAIPTDEFLYFTSVNYYQTIIIGIVFLSIVVMVFVFKIIIEPKYERWKCKKYLLNVLQNDSGTQVFKGKYVARCDWQSYRKYLLTDNGALESILDVVDMKKAAMRTMIVASFLLITVIVVNMAFWLLWIGTTRTHSIDLASTFSLNYLRENVQSLYNILDPHWIAVCRFRDDHRTTLGSLLRDFSLAPGAATMSPVPKSIILLQKILCNLLKIDSISNIYLTTNEGAMIGCVIIDNAYFFRVLDKNSNLVYYTSSVTWDRGIFVNNSTLPIVSNFSPSGQVWFKEGASTIFGGWSSIDYFNKDNRNDPPVLSYYFPLFDIDQVTFKESPKFICLVSTFIELSSFTNSIASRYGVDSTNFIYDNELRLVASSDGIIYNQQINPSITNKSRLEVYNASRKIVTAYSIAQSRVSRDDGYIVEIRTAPVVAVFPMLFDNSGRSFRIDWIAVSSIPFLSLYYEADTNARLTFWILFTEFSFIAIIASLLSSIITLEYQSFRFLKDSENDKVVNYLTDNNLHKAAFLRHHSSIVSIYNLVRHRNEFLDSLEISKSDDSVINDDELLPENNQAWLKYFNLSEYNVENLWILRGMYGPSSRKLKLYLMETHWLYRTYIVIVALLFCLVAIFEKPNWAISYPLSEVNYLLVGIEALFVFLIILDCILQTYLAYQRHSFKKKHFFLQIFLCCCYVLDLSGYAIFGLFRWSRLLRPFFFLYRNNSVRSASILIFRSMFDAKDVILLFFYVIIITDIFALSLTSPVEYLTADGDLTATTFRAFFPAFINAFILLTTSDNYGSCVDASVYKSRYYFIFWVIVTLIGKFFILSTLVARFSNSFYVHSNSNKKIMRNRRFMCLAATFIIFDRQNRGYISRRDYLKFMTVLLRTLDKNLDYEICLSSLNQKQQMQTIQDLLYISAIPDKLREMLQACFHAVDSNNDGFLTIEEFEESIDVGLLTFDVINKSDLYSNLNKKIWYFIVFRIISPLVLLFYILLLAAYGSLKNEKVLDVAVTILLVFMMLEIVIRVLVIYKSFFKYWNEVDIYARFLNRQDVVLICFSCALATYCWIKALSNNSLNAFSDENSFNRAFICVAGLRVFTISRNSLKIVALLINIIPTISEIAAVVLVAFYEYASLGGVFFSGMTIVTTGNSSVGYINGGNFNDFIGSIMLMYSLFIGSSWNTIMFDAVSKTSSAAVWFFMTWIFLITFLLSSLLFGVIIGRVIDMLVDDRYIQKFIRMVLSDAEVSQLRLKSNEALKLLESHICDDEKWVRRRSIGRAMSRSFSVDLKNTTGAERQNGKNSNDTDAISIDHLESLVNQGCSASVEAESIMRELIVVSSLTVDASLQIQQLQQRLSTCLSLKNNGIIAKQALIQRQVIVNPEELNGEENHENDMGTIEKLENLDDDVDDSPWVFKNPLINDLFNSERIHNKI